jgi:transmembrane sensor
MSKTRLEYLFQRYLNDVLTIEESEELTLFLQQSANDTTIKELLDQVWNSLAVDNRLSNSRANDIFSAILASDTPIQQAPVTMQEPEPKVRRLFTFMRVAIAASLLLFAGAIYYFVFYHQPEQAIVNNNDQPLKNDIPPGKVGAVLTLSDGTTINLDSSENGNIAQQGNTTIIKLDSQIKYNASSLANAQHLYNTISTTRGHQYQLILPDGSKVWLNAGSSIRFPIVFAGSERRVEVTGELYFEVKHNSSMPFTVAANGVEVHDLGTQFNINAYDNEDGVVTTLIEGKVSIASKQSATGNKQLTVLAPGQQGQVSETGDVKVVKDADVEAAIAWKNGQFMFEGNTIQSVMRQLERWYDVQVEYSGNVSKEEFVGTISRFGNISEVLNMLQKTGTVSFEIKGRKVIVK